MWIIIRIVVALGSFLYRYCFRRIPRNFPHHDGNISYHYKRVTNKGKLIKHYLETPLASPFMCCLTQETSRERLLMKIGFGEELNCGDADFDDLIFIAGDHPQIAETLRGNRELRALIGSLIPATLTSISITGETLRFEIPRHIEHEPHVKNLAKMRELLQGVQNGVMSRFSDPFYVKALLAESAVWTVVGYAVAAFLEMIVVQEDYHLFRGQLIRNGLFFAALLLWTWMFFLFMFLGRSSRTPRIMIESAILLFFALPLAGIQLVSDANRGLDSSPGIVVERPVQRAEKREHRGRRGRRWYSYHAHFAPQNLEWNGGSKYLALPTEMAISSTAYNTAIRTKTLRIEIARGFLGIPWYRKVE